MKLRQVPRCDDEGAAPEPVPETAPETVGEAPWYDGAVDDLERIESDDLEPERETIVALMGGSVRKGEWEPPEVLNVLALMGGVDLDFTEAVLLEGVTELRVLALMGGVNVKVPTDINVSVRGTGIMGGFTELNQRLDDPEAPTLRIHGWAVMGGVDVKVKKERKKWLKLGRE